MILGSHYEQKPLDFLSFTLRRLKRFLELFLAEFSTLNNGTWSFEEDLDTLELSEMWTSGGRTAMVHRLSVLFRARTRVFHSPCWPLPGSASEQFPGCIRWTPQERVATVCSGGLAAMPSLTHALGLCLGKVRAERRQEGGLLGSYFLSLYEAGR